MMRTGSALLWFLIVAPLLHSGAYAQPAARIAVRLEWVRGGAAASRDVQIRTEIRNISRRDVAVMVSSPENDFVFTVVGPDGRPAALTRRGLEWQSRVPNGSHVLVTLPPAQSVSEICVLSDLVDFSRPGTYRVVASRRFETINETVISNAIEINVP